jgi:predicted RNase H-like HicB family nuclease
MKMTMARDVIRKYTYRVEWSEEDGTHIARCIEFPSVMAHGNTPGKALAEIEAAVTAAVEWMREEDEPVPEPFGLKKYKGNLTLRIPSDTHRRLAIRAAEEGVSLNQYILSRVTAG